MKLCWKVTLCTVCLLSVLFGAGSSILLSLSFSNALERERVSAQEGYRSVLGTMQLAEELGALRNSQQLSGLLAQLVPQEAAAWSALELTSGGEVLLRSGAAAGSLRSTKPPQDDQNTVSYLSDSQGRHYIQISGCFQVDEQSHVLTLAYDISAIYDARAKQLRAYLAIFAGLLCAGALLSYLISFGLTRPLTRLSGPHGPFPKGTFPAASICIPEMKSARWERTLIRWRESWRTTFLAFNRPWSGRSVLSAALPMN